MHPGEPPHACSLGNWACKILIHESSRTEAQGEGLYCAGGLSLTFDCGPRWHAEDPRARAAIVIRTYANDNTLELVHVLYR